MHICPIVKFMYFKWWSEGQILVIFSFLHFLVLLCYCWSYYVNMGPLIKKKQALAFKGHKRVSKISSTVLPSNLLQEMCISIYDSNSHYKSSLLKIIDK